MHRYKMSEIFPEGNESEQEKASIYRDQYFWFFYSKSGMNLIFILQYFSDFLILIFGYFSTFFRD